MHAKRIGIKDDASTFVLVFDIGDEVAGLLYEYAKANQIAGAHFTAIGACSRVTLGFLDWEGKSIKPIPVHEQVEIISLVGNIAVDPEGEPKIHAHLVVGKSDGTTMGGHLFEAHVRPTIEMILEETPVHLQRHYIPEIGQALLRV